MKWLGHAAEGDVGRDRGRALIGFSQIAYA